MDIRDDKINGYLIKCDFGCLDHMLGISYFKWEHESLEEPELFYETTHAPYHTLWGRIKASWFHIIKSTSLDWDATSIGYNDAIEMNKLLERYIEDYNKWRNNING